MTDDSIVLTSDGAAIVAALLACDERPQRPTRASDDDLERFAIGWVTADEEARILETLVASPLSRDRLIAMHSRTREGISVSDWAFLGDAVRTSMRVYMSPQAMADQPSWPELLRRRTHEAVAQLSAAWAWGQYISDGFAGWANTRAARLLEKREGLAEDDLRVRSFADPALYFTLEGRPSVRNGRFHMDLHLSEENRRQVGARRIGLAISVGYEWVTLIEPQRRSLAGELLELEFEADGVEDGEFRALSVLRVLVEG